MRTTRGLVKCCLVALAATGAAGCGNSGSGPVGKNLPVPMPVMDCPVTGGDRTGKPYAASVVDLAPYGYIEQECFLSGSATNNGLSADGLTAPTAAPEQWRPYTTRVLVHYPADPANFNGTVVAEWVNVTTQQDVNIDYAVNWKHYVREGFASASVSIQKAGVDALKNWDPARYAALSHPGDSYSYDIFSQAAQAIRSGRVLGNLRGDVVIAAGESQSCNRLIDYVNLVQEQARVFDGFYPTSCPVQHIRKDLVPILWVNTESETTQVGLLSATIAARPDDEDLPVGVSTADGGLYRMWEIAGASHGNYYELSYFTAQMARDHGAVDGAAGPSSWDEAEASQYGEQALGAGPPPACGLNYFPYRYATHAAVHYLERWIRSGTPAPAADRIARPQAQGETLPTAVRDEHGNTRGGLRLPPIDVPAATYLADACPLLGLVIPFDPAKRRSLYPTHEDYVARMQAATDATVTRGYLLPADAAELMELVRAAPVPD